jgi:protein TonB
VPAYAQHDRSIRPRERAYALAAVVLVQAALGFALLTGLRVQFSREGEIVSRLINVSLQPPPPPIVPPPEPPKPRPSEQSSAPKAEPKALGGSPGRKPAHAPPSVTPVVAVRPSAAPSGGGSGTGPTLGGGAGGGTGGSGYGASGNGGNDLELLSGDIYPSDYPRRLAKAGIGGTVKMRCTVGPNGRATRCIVIRSSGVPELDALTPRLIEQRFVYRPARDRYGRPVSDDIEVEWTWD